MVLLRVASLLSIVLLFGCDLLFAQESATVIGRVTNTAGQPIAGVLVRFESLNIGISTDADGNYRLVIPGARIRPGYAVQITVTREGFEAQTRFIPLWPGDQRVQNFTLAPMAGAAPAHGIPTLSEWALVAMLLGFAAVGVVVTNH